MSVHLREEKAPVPKKIAVRKIRILPFPKLLPPKHRAVRRKPGRQESLKNQIPEPVAAVAQKGIPAQHNPRRLKVLHAADVIRMQMRQKEVAYLLRLNAVRHELILNLIRRAHRGRIQQMVKPPL